MIEITLKDGKSKIYIDEFDKPSEENRCCVYDSNKRYLDYFSLIDNDEEDYNEYLRLLRNKEDGFDIFDTYCFVCGYDYSTISPQDIMQTYIEDLVNGYDMEQVKEEIKDILFDIEFLDDDEFCETYDINKIGDIYFRGNW